MGDRTTNNLYNLETTSDIILTPFSCLFAISIHPRSLSLSLSLSAQGTAVGFKYYLGRLNMFSDEFLEAEQNLTWAYTNCPPGANRKRILSFLVPVRLLRGRLPMKELLVREVRKNKLSSAAGPTPHPPPPRPPRPPNPPPPGGGGRGT